MTPSWCFRPLPVSKRDIPAGNGGNRTGRPSDICRTASFRFVRSVWVVCSCGMFERRVRVVRWGCVRAVRWGGVFGVCSCGAEAPFFAGTFCRGVSFAAGRLSERPHRSGAGNGAVRRGRKSFGTAVSGNGRSGKRSLRGGLGASRSSDKTGSRGERLPGVTRPPTGRSSDGKGFRAGRIPGWGKTERTSGERDPG